MIEMQLEGVRVELPTNQPIVLLRERDGERYLPIWIGASEAAAIALSLQGVQTPRPMTHDPPSAQPSESYHNSFAAPIASAERCS